jgi:hypothetical protein
MEAISIALQGLQQASELASSSARRISSAGAAAVSSGGGADVVDLSAEMLALMQAKTLNGAMVAVAQTASEVDSHILNLVG